MCYSIDMFCLSTPNFLAMADFFCPPPHTTVHQSFHLRTFFYKFTVSENCIHNDLGLYTDFQLCFSVSFSNATTLFCSVHV